MANLAAKYRPKTLEDVTEQSIVVDMVRNLCSKPNLEARNFLFTGPAGCGKAQPLYSKIRTPHGWTTMGEIKVGDKVFTGQGNVAQVLGVFPQGLRDIYEITLADGRKIRVADNHLNPVLIDVNSYGDKPTHCLPYVNMDTIHLKHAIDKWNLSAYTIPAFDDNSLMADRLITSCELIGKDYCQCIYVDKPEHTYITDDNVVTHNTTLCRIIANILNKGQGSPIEIDAASHSGVDSVREIVSQAQSYPVGSEWKCFIIDECFHPNSLVSTVEGYRRIRDIKVGDRVYNLTGTAEVRKVFKNTVPVDHLILLRVSGRYILTTKSHLFFTDDGWVEAQNLHVGEYLYAKEDLCDMWQGVRSQKWKNPASLWERVWGNIKEDKSAGLSRFLSNYAIDEDLSCLRERVPNAEINRFQDLLSEVWGYISKAASPFSKAESSACLSQATICLSNLWKTNDYPSIGSQENLQRSLRSYFAAPEKRREKEKSTCVLQILRCMWESIYSKESWNGDVLPNMYQQIDRYDAKRKTQRVISSTDDQSQSYEQSRVYKEDDGDEGEKRYLAQCACYAWGQRSIYQAADSFEVLSSSWVDSRVSCENWSTKIQSNEVPYQLQVRSGLSRCETRSRGGWSRPQFEISAVSRRKESNLPRKLRVESIEIPERGHYAESFRDYFSPEQISSGYVQLYDLEIEGHPSYYINDCLVHNCHSISNQGWQSFLKTLEESPAKSIFLMATTNPEKIPATIISRVQTFQLSKISLQGIENRLKYIVSKENEEGQNITYEDSAISFIAKMANGGMRDSITLLEKAVAYDKNITSKGLVQALGLPNYDDFFSLLQAYAKKDNAQIAQIVDQVYNSGINFVKWMSDFHSFVVNVMKYIFLKDINKTTIPSYYQDKIAKYGPAHSSICLQLATTLVKLNHELKTTQYLQELTLTYLCFNPKK